MMKILAQATLDYLLFLNATDEALLDPRWAGKHLESLDFLLMDASEEEKAALASAAREALALIERDDSEEYTAEKLVSTEEKELLHRIADGSYFSEESEEGEDE